MAKNAKKRTKVKALPRSEQALTTKAAKKVKGGTLPLSSSTETSIDSRPGTGILKSTDGGRTW